MHSEYPEYRYRMIGVRSDTAIDKVSFGKLLVCETQLIVRDNIGTVL